MKFYEFLIDMQIKEEKKAKYREEGKPWPPPTNETPIHVPKCEQPQYFNDETYHTKKRRFSYKLFVDSEQWDANI